MQEKTITNINIENILPNRMQPRVVFQDEAIDELAESIKKHGIINPIIVRRLGDKYEIIAGERRYKASKSIGLEEIPAIIIEADDKKTAELALIENIQRKELSPIEEGMSYEKILQIGDMTQAELSRQLGKKQSTISNKLRLLKLDDSVKDALLEEKISERHARSLLKINNRKKQQEMLERVLNERLTVRQLDKEIEKINEEKEEKIEMTKNINLPLSDIILDNENEEITEPNSVVNPSFVDVKKIEETSEDIFKEKPIVNIEDLLKSSPNPKEEFSLEQPIVEENKEEMEEKEFELPKPKFFNMFPQDDEAEKQEEKQEEKFSPEMSFNINDIETIDNIEEKEELKEVKVDQIEEPKEELRINIPDINYELPKENNNEEEIEQISESKEEPMIDFNNFDPIIHNDFAGDEINEDDVEFFEEEEEEPAPVVDTSPKQMKDVIRIIRDCNDIIESYGYKIETEEFDLETMYQVIFKIYKH